MEWLQLKSKEEWQHVIQLSASSTVIVFKHSTKCSLSSNALRRLKDYDWPETTQIWWVDVIASRDLSRYIAEATQVHHESPQVLLMDKGVCFWDEDHLDIHPEEVQVARSSVGSSVR